MLVPRVVLAVSLTSSLLALLLVASCSSGGGGPAGANTTADAATDANRPLGCKGGSPAVGDPCDEGEVCAAKIACTPGGSIPRYGCQGGVLLAIGGQACPGDAGTCLSTSPVDAPAVAPSSGQKPTVAHAGACTAADLSQLETTLVNGGLANPSTLANGLSATCQACALSKETDSQWTPIVVTKNGASAFFDFGGCYGAVEGEACGKAGAQLLNCHRVACASCEASDVSTCQTDSDGVDGPCQSYGAALTTSCPDVAKATAECDSALDAVKRFCGEVDGG